MQPTLSQAVRLQRETLGLSQQELATLAGVGRLLIVNLESGNPNPKLRNLIRVLHVLGLQIAIEPGQDGIVIRQHAED